MPWRTVARPPASALRYGDSYPGSLSPSGVFALSGVLPLGLTPIAAVLLTILLAADFFIPLRQLGSYFHVAMNGMTSTKRIFALLDAPEPEHGSKELPEFGASGRGVGVEFRGVSYRYADADVDAGGAAGAGPDAAGLRVPVLRVPVVYRPHRIPICGTRMWTALMRAAARVTRAKRATPCATWPSVRCRRSHCDRRAIRFRQVHSRPAACRHACRI